MAKDKSKELTKEEKKALKKANKKANNKSNKKSTSGKSFEVIEGKKNLTVKIRNVQLSFHSLAETEVYNGQDTGKYTASITLDKETHGDTIEFLKDEVSKIVSKTFDIKAKKLDKIMKTFVYDVTKDRPQPTVLLPHIKDLSNHASFKDDGVKAYSLKCSTNAIINGKETKLTILDPDGERISPSNENIYSGNKVNIIISVWASDGVKKAVGFNFVAMKITDFAEQLGGGEMDLD